MCFEVFQPTGVINDAAWVYGVYRAVVGISSGFAPVFIERLLPTDYTPKTMRLVIVLCFVAFVPAYIIIVTTQNIYGKLF
jgi:hypothetical protein